MNKSYRSIWNAALGAWVAAPEITAARGKRAKSARTSVAAVIAVAMGSLAGLAPTGALAQYANAFGTATGTGAIAIGSNTTTPATAGNSLTGSIAIGDGATASAVAAGSSIAFGTGALASSPAGFGDSLAVGTKSKATGQDAVAIGGQAWATGTNAISIGGGNDLGGNGASATNAIVLGAYGIANATGAVAVGTSASALGIRALALGGGAVANNAGDVALGANSTTAAAVGTASSVINGTTYNYFGTTPTSTVSVGTAGNERTITNVAAGRVSATSTDAVNGSQLFATNSAITSVANTPLTFTGNTGTVDRKLGQTLSITGLGTAGGNYSGANLRTAVVGNEVQLQMTDAPVFTSVTTGNSTLNTNGLTIVGGPSVTTTGINANNTAITNVAAGTNATDAVNLSQLNAVNATAGKGFNVTTAATGSGTAVGTSVQNIAPGATATYTAGNNVVITQNGAEIQIATSSTPTFTSVNTGSLTATGPTSLTGGTTIGGSLTVSPATTVNMGGNVITNVAAGTNATDAVNVSQLTTATTTAANTWINGSPTTYAAPTSTGTNSTAVGSGASVNANNAVAIGTGASATTANSVALGNNSTTGAAVATTGTTIAGTGYTFAGAAPTGVVSVGSAGNERQVTNVAAGQLNAGSTDAVNGSQLYATNAAINNIQTTVASTRTHYYSVNDAGVTAGNYNNDGATGANAIAIGTSAVAASTGGVALGAGATANRGGMNGQREAFSNVSVLSAQGAVSVGSAGNERQITNVAGGTAPTDAVNVRQLQAVQTGAVNYATYADGSVNYNQVTLGNGQAANGTVISNVAPGVAGTDAVNVNQLNAGVAGVAAYVDQRVNQLNAATIEIGKKAYSGVAAAMAMESAPYVVGKVTYAAGLGYYEGQSAVGISLRKTADNGRWSLTGGVSATSRGTVGVRVGIGGVWD